VRDVFASSVLAAALVFVAACESHAQTGWEARVTAVPNPIPAGRCAGLSVEPVDDHGYRHTTLSNGVGLDFHKFVYESSDVTHFAFRKDTTIAGAICANADAPAASTTVTVTLPDGTKGQVQVSVVPKGQPSRPAVVYRPQAPLRVAGSPEYAPGFVPGGVAASGVAASGVATAASIPATTSPATTSPPPTTPGAAAQPLKVTVTAEPLALAGTYGGVDKVFTLAVTATALTMAGTYNRFAMTVLAAPLAISGTYSPTTTLTTSRDSVSRTSLSPKPTTP
jgi:hypothetical protein